MAATPNSSAPSAPIKDDYKYDFMGDLDSIAKDENNKSRTWKLFELTTAKLFPKTHEYKKSKKQIHEEIPKTISMLKAEKGENFDIKEGFEGMQKGLASTLELLLYLTKKPDMLDKIGETMGAVGITAKAIGHDAYQALKMGAETIVSAVKHCSEKIGELGGQIKEKFGKVKSLISDMFKTIAKGLKKAKEKVKDKALEIIPDPVIKAAEKAAETVKTAKQAVGKKASNLKDKAEKIGYEAIQSASATIAKSAINEGAYAEHKLHALKEKRKNQTRGRG